MLLNVVVNRVEARRYLTVIRERRVAALLSQLHGVDMGVERGLSEDFKAHLGELVEPALVQ